MSKSSDPVLDRLGEIEAEDDESDDTIDLMEEVAQRPGGLQLLLERFGHSEHAMVVRSLSFLLARAANQTTVESSARIYDLIAKLRCTDDVSTLINCMTTIQRQAICDIPWPGGRAPASLFPFLMHCLTQGALVAPGAIDVLMRLYEDGRFPAAFSDEQQRELRAKLVALSSVEDEALKLDLRSLAPFVNGG